MKKLVKFCSIFLFTLVYCFALNIGVYSNFFITSQNHTNSEQEEYFSSITKNITFQTSPSESSVQSFNKYPTQSFKSNFKTFFTLCVIIDHLVDTKFSQSKNLLSTFLFQHHKKEIIYPFHFFW